MVRAGSSKVTPDFNIKRNSSYPYCVIHYVMGGTGWVIHNNKKYDVHKGQAFILMPNEAHQYYTDPDNPFKFNWIEFSGGDCSRLAKNIVNNSSPVLDVPCSSRLSRYILHIHSLIKRDDLANKIQISRTLYSMMLFLLDRCNTKDYMDLSNWKSGTVTDVLQFIDNNLHEDLKIEKLAKISNFSTEHFIRLFHKAVGTTPFRYIKERRINRAKELLGTEGLSVDELSDCLGFCNSSHFIRTFKKAEGVTPAEYQRQCIMFLYDPH
ncbi:MAG TPA: AraC family transcriptional regulator [Ruminiclostridium sp.]